MYVIDQPWFSKNYGYTKNYFFLYQVEPPILTARVVGLRSEIKAELFMKIDLNTQNSVSTAVSI